MFCYFLKQSYWSCMSHHDKLHCVTVSREWDTLHLPYETLIFNNESKFSVNLNSRKCKVHMKAKILWQIFRRLFHHEPTFGVVFIITTLYYNKPPMGKWIDTNLVAGITGVRGSVDCLAFFEYLSPFFLSIEFHCTFSISYKILPYFVYYFCILIK